MIWQGVMPAITTPFAGDGSVDHDFLRKHCQWLVENGSTGLVALGSLGEGATLDHDEKRACLRSCVDAVGGAVPVIAGVAALSTREAVALAADAAESGCRGLMVLPPYVHKGSWREAKAHFDAVFEVTELSCMLYNNPIAYGVDVRPEAVSEFASDHRNLHAVKESSGDVRRITAIRAAVGDRLSVLVGLDDALVEGVAAGATGWIAGLVNALPRESVALFERARDRADNTRELYEWFLPLLRMDTVPEFVQLIKLVQQEVGMGSERVRPPRLAVEGADRERALSTIRGALASNPLAS